MIYGTIMYYYIILYRPSAPPPWLRRGMYTAAALITIVTSVSFSNSNRCMFIVTNGFPSIVGISFYTAAAVSSRAPRRGRRLLRPRARAEYFARPSGRGAWEMGVCTQGRACNKEDTASWLLADSTFCPTSTGKGSEQGTGQG